MSSITLYPSNKFRAHLKDMKPLYLVRCNAGRHLGELRFIKKEATYKLFASIDVRGGISEENLVDIINELRRLNSETQV